MSEKWKNKRVIYSKLTSKSKGGQSFWNRRSFYLCSLCKYKCSSIPLEI